MKKQKNKYAVVDLEATSASSQGRIIQVGIVIIEDDKIVNQYQTDVNPHEKLDTHIKLLTGITDQQLEAAPDFSEVAKEIYELIEDCVFVAHNVKFDANLLAEELFLAGYELRNDRVDTVELSQIFFPTLEKYKLSQLTEELGIELSDAHTAISDALATAELFLKIKEKIKTVPRETLEMILSLADHLIYETRLVIEECLPDASVNAGEYLEMNGILTKPKKVIPSSASLEGSFDQVMARLGMAKREKQALFAQSVTEELKHQEPSFVEAQAGIGKTFGYLIPLLLEKGHQEQIVISVPTIVLQDQIMEKEGRLIEDNFQISFHSLKSPRHYIKLDLFYEKLQEKQQNRVIARYNMQLLVWLLETETGDLGEIRQKQLYEAYFDRLRHDGNLSRQSIFYEMDFWQRSFEHSQQSRVLITNHAYLLTRIDDDTAFVANKRLIIDEGQKFFLAIEEFSKRELNMTETLQELYKINLPKERFLEKRLLESLYFELGHLVEGFSRYRQKTISEESIGKIRQDLSELDLPEVRGLKDIFSTHFEEFWFESHYQDETRTIVLKAARPEFLTGTQMIPSTTKTIFVSATLHISRKVSLPDLLGYEVYRTCELPQDQHHNQKIFLLEEALDPLVTNEEDYYYYIKDQLALLQKSFLPILVLFTSKKSLLAVSELLDEAKIPHLAQMKNGLAKHVKRRFENGEAQILLGTGSFWEGVDFSHHERMIQVITRLPFDNPEDQMSKKINRYLRRQKKNPFYDYTLPVMMLRAKQAIGRTNRHEEQRSAVVFLDKRLTSKRYSRQIQQSLKELANIEECANDQLLSEVKGFLIRK